ncbi:MAG: cell division protein FtsZ, partial [Acutalibacteraceae bacterium]
FTVSPDISLEEVEATATIISAEANPDAKIIWGVAFDESLEDAMKVTVIATGFEKGADNGNAAAAPQDTAVKTEEKTEPVKAAQKPTFSGDDDADIDNIVQQFDILNKRRANKF